MNISSKAPYLRDVDADQCEAVITAVDLLQMARGAKRVGLNMSSELLSVREFNLVTYLSAEVDRYG